MIWLSNFAMQIQVTKPQVQEKKVSNNSFVAVSVTAIGSDRLAYRWLKDDKDIICPECDGVQTEKLIICRKSSPDHAGRYKCVVRCMCGVCDKKGSSKCSSYVELRGENKVIDEYH